MAAGPTADFGQRNDFHFRIDQLRPNSEAKSEAVTEVGCQRRQVLAELAFFLWHPWLGGNLSLEQAERLCGDRCQALHDARFGKDDRAYPSATQELGDSI
ncbi:hypothetical protein CBM2634_U330004 [Cupriavidus taiwanensis]|uniref:Uncharacterized protein n=1 Tax=Cupriavidus taiwanensis TaxID=164546 RepID=A0A375JE22_9BURK|nr:hypothetical protein CBM2634_U330004 [Cupriavidus taiwanensis]